eukprot:2999759-Rhodomonas_salina.3
MMPVMILHDCSNRRNRRAAEPHITAVTQDQATVTAKAGNGRGAAVTPKNGENAIVILAEGTHTSH